MPKITTKAVFKTYSPDQPQLLPQSLEDLIAPDHLVRVVRRVIDQMDTTAMVNQYPGGGSSAYNPVMMIKVILYAYAIGICTGRKIARALRQDVTFLWLAAYNQPDFRTINEFRSGKLKQTIDELFKSMLMFLVEHGYVKFENYFVDGSPFAADANRHKMVWKKNAERYKEMAEKKCEEVLRQIEALNEVENREYGDCDLEETGDGKVKITQEKISEKISQLNTIIEKTTEQKKKKRRAATLKKQLEEHTEKINTYNGQLAHAGERSGYSKTDPDAVAMRMKNDETLPAYNAMIGTEDQFVVNFSIHQTGSDMACFKPHVEQLEKHTDKKPEVMGGDAGFGSEQNYELLEQKEIGNYLKYNTFHYEQTRQHSTDLFHKDHFTYDSATDTFTCPNYKQLMLQSTTQKTNKTTGYVSTVKIYESESCEGCPFAAECKKSEDKNRKVAVNERWEKYKKQARGNLMSEKGIALRKQRGCDVESVFGDLKHNQHFRRFHLRGKQKVKAEFGIVVLSHNLRKIHFHDLKKVG
ncbi:MAG TPA: IS1182 family transposase [Chitinophagales bacterium]|nr:IS1182 family transposase [Chitinophagales bacterium]